MRLIAHTDVIELSQLFTHKLRIRMQEALYVCSAQIFLFVCIYVYPFEGRTFSSMCANDLRPNLLWIFAVLYAFIFSLCPTIWCHKSKFNQLILTMHAAHTALSARRLKRKSKRMCLCLWVERVQLPTSKGNDTWLPYLTAKGKWKGCLCVWKYAFVRRMWLVACYN